MSHNNGVKFKKYTFSSFSIMVWKIIGRKEDQDGAITHLKIQDAGVNSIVTLKTAIRMIKDGKISGYHVYERDGKGYIRKNPPYEAPKILVKETILYFLKTHGLQIIMMVVGIISILAMFFTQEMPMSILKYPDLPQDDLSLQIESLIQMEASLMELQGFVQNQRRTVIEYQNTVAELEKEKQSLEPLVKADKEIIGKLFEIQEKRAKDRVWTERAIGFVSGVLASLLVTLLATFGKGILQKFKRK